MSAIRFERVSKTYGNGPSRVQALCDVDVAIEPGEFVSIVGPSGSGKSTLLHLAGAMDRPSAGRVLLGLEAVDTSLLDDDALTLLRRRQLGFVFQFFHLLPTLSIEENIALPRLIDGEPMSRVRPRVEALLERLSLAQRRKHRPAELSGGEMQRVALARALIGEPAILLLDEPTGNLDSETGRSVLDLLGSLARDGQRALVMVTHDPSAAARTDRVLRLRDGRLED